MQYRLSVETKSTHGGERPGAGRKKKPEKEKKNSYGVYLTEAQKKKLVKKHGSLTKALESLL